MWDVARQSFDMLFYHLEMREPKEAGEGMETSHLPLVLLSNRSRETSRKQFPAPVLHHRLLWLTGCLPVWSLVAP